VPRMMTHVPDSANNLEPALPSCVR
jgi:hypothetical protein